MPAWDSVISLALSGLALVLVVLVITKYKKSRGMRLSLYCVLVATSVFRIVRGLMTGADPSWVDALAAVFFGYSAVAEAIPFFRSRSGRGGR